MITLKMVPYQRDTALTGYMPVPRELVGTELPVTAILLYSALLDRATLSPEKSVYRYRRSCLCDLCH